MKTDSSVIFLSLLCVFIILLFKQWAVLPMAKHASPYTPKAIGKINKTLQEDLALFIEAGKDFSETTHLFKDHKTTKKDLLRSYKKLRNSFKTIEFALEYQDKEAYDKLINGAPLPKLEKKVADLAIIEPKGLQVIDELIIEIDAENNTAKKELSAQASTLDKNINNLYAYLKVRALSNRQFFEGSRQAIIRMSTLGVTGFDTPGTLNGIDDANVVLKTLKKHISQYKYELNNVNKKQLLDHSLNIIKKGLEQTNDKEFNDFDRLTFTKEVINPLYKTLKDIHLALDYETIKEVSRYPQAINYESDNLFNSDFLNNFYFVSLPNDSTINSKATLGKLLFYDPILSQNNTMACVTCHVPEKAFTDGMTTSLSNTNTPLKRNAMTLNYSVYATRYFHDLRANRLEDQFEHVVVSQDEFNSSYQEIIEKIQGSETYRDLFKKAFPNNKRIRFNDIDYALAAYVMKLNTFDSPIDQFFQGQTKSLPENVKRGFNLFTGKAACATCHFTPLFSGNLPPLFIDSEAEVLGVPDKNEEPWTWDDDLGRVGNGMSQEVAAFYEGAFKTPTIRNIEKTAPYMHNGVFNTLEEVMDFYNKGGGAGNGLDIEHQTLASDPLELNDQEIADIIAFMKALNDTKTFEAPKDIPRDFENERLNKRQINVLKTVN